MYDISWAWLCMYCVSIAVMLTAALISIWCTLHTTIPDVLSYCSSLTRDSEFLAFAKTGSTPGGVARAKIPADIELKMGEVVDRSDFVNKVNPISNGSGGRGERKLGRLAIAPPEYLRTPKRDTLYA